MKVCRYLFDEINFVSSRIVPCCSKNLEDEEIIKKYFVRPNEESTPDVINQYLEKREKYIQMFKDGIVPEFCQNCNEYEGIDKEDNLCFEKIYINHKSQCNCRCIYCCLAGENNTSIDFERINKEKTYDIKPILEELKNKNLISEKTFLYLCGGEPTLHKEDMDYIIKYAKENNIGVTLFTNAINYNEPFASFLKSNKAELSCSLDSSSNRIYKKIKRVDAYYKVIKNLQNYSLATKNNPNSKINLKYIIYPKINDNLKEFKNFINFAKEINASEVRLSIDRFWFAKNKDKKIPRNIIKIIKYFVGRNNIKDIKRSIEYTMLHKDYVKKVIETETISEYIQKYIKKLIKRS